MVKLERTFDVKLPTGVLGGTLAADHETIVAGCLEGVYVANVRSRHVERIGLHSSYVSSVALFDNDRKILSAGYDGALQWFDAESRSQIREVQLHDFWSWDLALSPDGTRAASVTGQYLAGGYKYEPQAETEPSLKIVDTETGEIVHSLPHTPSVQAVAFSPDNQFVAAGNLMGEVRIWKVDSGEQVGGFTTDDFTSWGIIKTHSYIGGIFALSFTPDASELLLAGMGKMRDPMAGNGRQLWQKWTWHGDAKKTGEINHAEAGEGADGNSGDPSQRKLFRDGRTAARWRLERRLIRPCPREQNCKVKDGLSRHGSRVLSRWQSVDACGLSGATEKKRPRVQAVGLWQSGNLQGRLIEYLPCNAAGISYRRRAC